MTDLTFKHVNVVEEPTGRDLRVEICGRAGTNQSAYASTTLANNTLNSVYAYLTGEFSVSPKRVHGAGSKPREDVARECGLGDWAEKFSDWEETGSWGEDNESMPTFTKDDLESILAEMDKRGDQRDWV